MLKAIIYDFDGVLVDSLPLHLEAYNYALSKFGIQTKREEIIDKCFNKLDTVAARNFGIKDVQKFSQYYLLGITRAFKHITLYQNVISTLKGITALNIPIGIGSLRDRKNIDWALKKLKIKKFFTIIVTQNKTLKNKAKIFSNVCKGLNVKPQEAVIVGDAENDIQVAKQLKTKIILFYPKKHQEFYHLADLKKLKPDYIIHDQLEILNIIKNKNHLSKKN